MNFDRSSYINQPSSIDIELTTLFKKSDGITIFEIGACEGEDSIKYSRLFPLSTIYAFEPLPANIPLIENNLLKYGVHNVAFFNKALSSANGKAIFYVSSGKPENAIESDWDYGNKSSSLLSPGRHLKDIEFIRFDTKIEVDTIRLSSFCEQNNIKEIDFIHMDVQGAELLVLKGAENFLPSIKAIWLEVSKVDLYENQPLAEDVAVFMKENNFRMIKSTLDDFQGDQLYISNLFYSNPKLLWINTIIKAKSLMRRILNKINFR